MASYTNAFQELVSEYIDMNIDFPKLKAVTVAQWILESGRGNSRLAQDHNNYAGLKFRPEMNGFATPVTYQASDGQDTYCAFASLRDFVVGYWHFLDRPAYKGWRDNASSAESFIDFIGNAYSTTGLYAEKVLGFVIEAQNLIDSLSVDVDFSKEKPVGTSEPAKPPVQEFIQSPNFSSRNGERIRRIVMHYTTSRNVRGTIEWFKNPASRVSAHYIIARDGTIFQMVRDADKAWHAKNANADAIGIEHSAAKGDTMTAEQDQASSDLVRWLLSEYKLPASCIDGHKYTPENAGSTDCPDHLFGEDSENAIKSWVKRHFPSPALS